MESGNLALWPEFLGPEFILCPVTVAIMVVLFGTKNVAVSVRIQMEKQII